MENKDYKGIISVCIVLAYLTTLILSITDNIQVPPELVLLAGLVSTAYYSKKKKGE